jgi:MscS family membrane protein
LRNFHPSRVDSLVHLCCHVPLFRSEEQENMTLDWTTLTEAAGSFYNEWSGVAHVFLIILAVLVINAVLQRVLGMLAGREQAQHHVWRDALLGSIALPLQGMVWLVGLTIAVRVLTRDNELSLLSSVFPPTRDVAVIAVVTWFLLRFVGRVELNLRAYAHSAGRELDPTASDAIGKLVRASIVITALLVAMQTLGFSIAGILAFGGMGGIAVGFAAQSLVANLLGGLTVFASRPFKVGEYIILPGTELMGGVEHIGWRATRVIGFDRKPFYVPNATFNTTTVINHSRMTNRRIMETIHVRYRDMDKIPAIVADANEMLDRHPGIEHDFFILRFDSCGDFALKLLLYAFTVSTDYTDYMCVKEDILLKIAAIVREHEAELAVPVSNVYMPEGVRFKAEPQPAAIEPIVADLVERPQGT